MKKLIYTAFFSCLTLAVMAQDKHFTQFYAAPLTLNPALTGTFDGRYRFSTIYRDQWRKVLDNPYQTFAAGLDLRFPVAGAVRSPYDDAAGVGLLFFTDVVPSVEFRTTQIALSGAFHKALNTESNQYLSVGFQFGITQRSIGYSNLTFNDQFDGTTGYTDATGEDLPQNNFAFGDMSVGLNYSYAPRRGVAFFAGVALHHVLEPQVSFYFDDENPEDSGDNKLFRQYSAQFTAQLPIADGITISPRAIAALQGPHLEINAGTNFRFQLGEDSPAALHLGSWVRPVTTDNSSFELDAVILMVGFEMNNVLLGLSYDATLNDLNASRQGQGAFEISVAYLGNYENEAILCPKF
ncbi:MAG: PorP/SprF family type IX secretion system membrane protein [Saprospiraceae bacterium]